MEKGQGGAKEMVIKVVVVAVVVEEDVAVAVIVG